jgi:hypothetical protein
MRRSLSLAVALTLSVVGVSAAQVTGMPSFDAPYRAFAQHEFGGTLSFPASGGALGFPSGGTGIEGQYRFGYQTFDVGMRGGLYLPGNNLPTTFLIGVTGRDRVLTHTEQFPLDGAVVVGLGGEFNSNGHVFLIPAGLSLGRRLDVKDSPVSIVPYGEPVLFITTGGGSTDLNFALGLGGDFRLSQMFDARVSVGLGDIRGVAISAVWIH